MDRHRSNSPFHYEKERSSHRYQAQHSHDISRSHKCRRSRSGSDDRYNSTEGSSSRSRSVSKSRDKKSRLTSTSKKSRSLSRTRESRLPQRHRTSRSTSGSDESGSNSRSRMSRSKSRERKSSYRTLSSTSKSRGRKSRSRSIDRRSMSNLKIRDSRSTESKTNHYGDKSRTHNYDKYSKESNKSKKSNDDKHSEINSFKKMKKDKKTKKKKKARSSSSSSVSSSSSLSEAEQTLLERLQQERQHKQDEIRRRKALLKTLETPEEKRLRRLQKKDLKERKRKEKMGWDSEYLHYTNADNPYGDNNLLDTFVWQKKLQKDGLTHLTKEEIQKRSQVTMEENRLELVKVKKRRQERELERAERDKLMELEQRQREAAQFSHFSKQEDNFQLEQARIRSQIRVEDGRAKPIDLLAQYISSEAENSSGSVLHVHEPYTHLTGLTLHDLEDLMEDIKVYQQLDKEGGHQRYWRDLTIIVTDEIRRLRMRDSAIISAAAAPTSSTNAVANTTTAQRHGIHSAVAAEVSSQFRNKSVSQLEALQSRIEGKLSGDTAGVDVGYWESLLSQLKAFQARARLRERHRYNLKQKLVLLKAEQGVKESDDGDRGSGSPGAGPSGAELPVEDSEETTLQDEEVAELCRAAAAKNAGNDEAAKAATAAAVAAYTTGRFSPKLLAVDQLEPGTVVLEEEESDHSLQWQRRTVVAESAATAAAVTAAALANARLTDDERRLQREAQKNMSSDEVQFSVEAKLDPQQYLWSDKYRPRKPRYFNRVHTGFEWNKYNQTHYDMDNPPPKIVQGYKFNIFYPDLIEKSNTPEYQLVPIKDNPDFAMLKFTAGPPYEDIAFKIVNREWEYSYKRGFRCQFHNNIFQLWFHFKRYRYRR